MKILISVKDSIEAKAVSGVSGVNIVDIKNPSEGTLGANHPWVIDEIINILPSGTEVAASIGDLDFKPGGASLAALGAASLGVDYITAAMHQVSIKDVKTMTKTLLKAIEDLGTGLIIAGYADYKRYGGANPFEFLPYVEGADYIMLDTAVKDGKNILNFTSIEELSGFKEECHALGLKLIIAGSIRYPELNIIKKVGPDVLGFRGIVCENGVVKRGLVERLVRELA